MPQVVELPPIGHDTRGALVAFVVIDIDDSAPLAQMRIPGDVAHIAGYVRSDTDPFDKTSPPIQVGPHWMIMWPFDPKATGLPVTHRQTGAYIMWSGSPYAHVHVMGRP